MSKKDKIVKALTVIVAGLLFIGVIASGIYADYYIWRAKHPSAPIWTYLF